MSKDFVNGAIVGYLFGRGSGPKVHPLIIAARLTVCFALLAFVVGFGLWAVLHTWIKN